MHQLILTSAHAVEAKPSRLGLSPHLIAVACKRGQLVPPGSTSLTAEGEAVELSSIRAESADVSVYVNDLRPLKRPAMLVGRLQSGTRRGKEATRAVHQNAPGARNDPGCRA